MHVFLLYYLFGSPISICIRVCWTCCNMWLVCLFRGPFIFNWLQKGPCLTFWSKVRLGNMAENELILCKIRKVRFHVAFSAIFINIFTFWYRANWQWEMFALLYLSFYLIYFLGLIIALDTFRKSFRGSKCNLLKVWKVTLKVKSSWCSASTYYVWTKTWDQFSREMII